MAAGTDASPSEGLASVSAVMTACIDGTDSSEGSDVIFVGREPKKLEKIILQFLVCTIRGPAP